MAFQRPSYEVPDSTLFINLSGSLLDAYNAFPEGSYEQVQISAYDAIQMTFFAREGNGLFFGQGTTPTRAIFVYIKLEQQPGSDVWPLLLLFFSVPEEAHSLLRPDFFDFVESVSIAPPGAAKLSKSSGDETHQPVEETSLALSKEEHTVLEAGALPGNDLQLKAPFSGMTYEEYRDVNRRVTPALLLASMVLPGTLHLYAGQNEKAWITTGVAGGGLGLVAGGLSADRQGWLAAGGGLFLGAILYDWIDGSLVIEEKRTRVWYKYGKRMHTKQEP